MTDPARHVHLDLQDIKTRNRNARHIIAGFARALPTLTEAWRYLDRALADAPRLIGEIVRRAPTWPPCASTGPTCSPPCAPPWPPTATAKPTPWPTCATS